LQNGVGTSCSCCPFPRSGVAKQQKPSSSSAPHSTTYPIPRPREKQKRIHSTTQLHVVFSWPVGVACPALLSGGPAFCVDILYTCRLFDCSPAPHYRQRCSAVQRARVTSPGQDGRVKRDRRSTASTPAQSHREAPLGYWRAGLRPRCSRLRAAIPASEIPLSLPLFVQRMWSCVQAAVPRDTTMAARARGVRFTAALARVPVLHNRIDGGHPLPRYVALRPHLVSLPHRISNRWSSTLLGRPR
jgi:hypothetical protein